MPQLVDNRYRIVKPLGTGGMAEVYLAHDDVLDRNVALKILNGSYSDDDEFIERFRREAQSAAGLAHPNIVSIYDRGESDDQGTYYIAMEYLPGGSLKDRINSRGALPARTAAEVALQIAEALKAAHEKDVVHRDIKPHNILVTESGNLKVTDFGIARAATSSTMTRTGSVMGTAHYISPEQAMAEPADPQSDLYSLGVVLYEMLTGELPFDAETSIGIAMKHVNEHPTPPGDLDSSIPEGLDAITLRLMSKDPEERYPDESELIRDLQSVVGGNSPSDATTMILEGAAVAGAGYGGYGSYGTGGQNGFLGRHDGGARKERRWLLPLAALGILALLALVGWIAYTTIPEPPPTSQVPELEGLSLQDARDRLGENFNVAVSERRDSEESEDTILEQNPAPGEEREQGSDISVVVSGQQVVEVPDVVGDPQDEAESALSDEDFSVNVETEESTTGEEGNVVSQSPSAGDRAGFESEVTITVGEGPSAVETPDLSGMTVSEAESELSDADLELGEQSEAASSEVDEGGITDQTPAAGSEAEPGSAVDVTVSTGPEPISVPNLYGYNRADAEAILQDSGLSLGQVPTQNTGELDEGLIFSQSLAGGDTAEPGTAIDVTVSAGPASISVPNVVGDNLGSAQQTITNAGLGYTSQSTQSSEPEGTVLSTDPGSGTEVEPNTQVTLIYSLGPPEPASAPASNPEPAPEPIPDPAPEPTPEPTPTLVPAPESAPEPIPNPAPTPSPDSSGGGGNSEDNGGNGDGGNSSLRNESQNGNDSLGGAERGGSGGSEDSGNNAVEAPNVEAPETPDTPEAPDIPDS